MLRMRQTLFLRTCLIKSKGTPNPDTTLMPEVPIKISVPMILERERKRGQVEKTKKMQHNVENICKKYVKSIAHCSCQESSPVKF